MRGPGVRITLSGRLPDGVGVGITDHDVADLVNVLWIAGAEAISVNQVRLTALSAIRAAANVILVGLLPVTAPYVIEALGDAGELGTRLERSAVVDRLRNQPDSPATALTVTRPATMTLPAAPLPVLRNVRRTG
ncbi:DUF881 domain-containing protein [Candidatus Frankia nodulisporulans]|uniref:DUF881 domain-containing protein n=1 Tax=Candidatus Frankia nodulisporulans TaxID=2060052 RepID=UPI0013D32217|nr:DUF881 domain-containing protein [Candidatus Frankia nodulisporulans]